MNVINISDFHLVPNIPSGRIDNPPKDQFKKLIFILSYAKKHKCIVLQAGDFSDVPRSWYLLPRIAALFTAYKVQWFSIFGQHDTYLYSELTRDATTLGVLAKTNLLTILGDEPVIVGNLRLYGSSFGTKVPRVKRNAHFKNVLVIHDNISDKPLFYNHKIQQAENFLEKYPNFELILVGDIHRKFRVYDAGRRLLNTGPIVRTKNTDYMRAHKPGFYVWNSETNKIKWVTIPHEPAENIFQDKQVEVEEYEQSKIISSIEEIKESDKYKVDSELSRVLIEMYDEFSVTDQVKGLLSQLLEDVK